MKKNLSFLLLILIISMLSLDVSTNAAHKPYIPVLTYHHLDEKMKTVTTIHPDDFKCQMLALKQAGYTTLTIQELTSILKKKTPMPPKPVLITFDDGYLSNYTYAYPILKDIGFKATIFVVANECGKTPGVNPHFTWEQAKEMYDSGIIDIQSHSYNSHFSIEKNDKLGKLHLKPALTTKIFINGKPETLSQYKTRVTLDLAQSKQIIEKNIGNKVTAISYPFGAHNKIVRYIAKALGFEIAFTAKNGVVFLSDDPFQLKRINVSGYYSDKTLLLLVQNQGKLPIKQ